MIGAFDCLYWRENLFELPVKPPLKKFKFQLHPNRTTSFCNSKNGVPTQSVDRYSLC